MARRAVSRIFSDLPNRCFSSLNEMRNEKQFCDVTFNVGTTSICAHRAILAAAIPYFRNEFSRGIEELSDIELNVFTCLIDYAYTHKVNINTENVQGLLAGAHRFRIDEVKEACCDFLSDSLEPEGAWNIRKLAIRFNCAQLLEEADCYITENFNLVSQTRDFLNYPQTYLEELIQKNDLNVGNEKDVFNAVLRWVKESSEKGNYPENMLTALLCKIRMTFLEPQYLTKVVETEDIIRTSVSCRDLIDEAKIYNLFPEMRKPVCSFITQQRRKINEKFTSQDIATQFFYVLDEGRYYFTERFDLLEKKTVYKEKKLLPQLGGSVTQFQDKIYFFYKDTTLQYDPKQKSCKMMSRMPTPREFLGAAALKGKIYVCGGEPVGRSSVTNVVECFDPEKNEWVAVKPMPTSRAAGSAVSLGEYIFVIGGSTNLTVLDCVERYDERYDKWRCMSPMLTKRRHAGACASNGKIYVSGGLADLSVRNNLATTEVYDPVTDQWIFTSPMNSPRWKFALLSCQGKLYAVGGVCETDETFDVYDPESGRWTSSSPKCPITLNGAATVSLTPIDA